MTEQDKKYIDFNSRAHVERDNRVQELKLSQDNFNSRAHVERDDRSPYN